MFRNTTRTNRRRTAKRRVRTVIEEMEYLVYNIFESKTFLKRQPVAFEIYHSGVCERLECRFVIFTLATCVEVVGNPEEEQRVI